MLSGSLFTKKSMPMMLLIGRVLEVRDISDIGVSDVTASNFVGQSHKAKCALFICQCPDCGKEPTPISIPLPFLTLILSRNSLNWL